MAHVRRKFVDVFASQESAIAEEAIPRIADLYAVEKEARGKPPDERAMRRQSKAKPVFDDLEKWLYAQLPRILGKSPLAQAIRYALGRMPKARPYLDNGSLELNNNSVERAMKPLAISRKNWMFAGSRRRWESHDHRLHADGNRKAEQRRPASLAELGARLHRRPQDQLSRRVDAFALRCASSLAGNQRPAPEYLRRTLTVEWDYFP